MCEYLIDTGESKDIFTLTCHILLNLKFLHWCKSFIIISDFSHDV
jgi:hypothetical protein